MNERKLYPACLLIISAFLLFPVSCGKHVYEDGVYTGKSGTDDRGAWGEAVITIKDGRIAGCQFTTLQKDGTVKGEDYGKVNGEISNQDFYNKAQLAVRAMSQYAQTLSETGDLNSVDAVSGATIAYNQFVEAVDAALSQALEKAK
ncbi:MAG: FMN-binding protein [Spirochaetaceae bacterium]|jgi:major membrane immunogen (membrane-anchored lipoprotein)|nr:FMN-binding protein [Spirochaetaceae bacterium]